VGAALAAIPVEPAGDVLNIYTEKTNQQQKKGET
jgi:hypothetical protein